MSEYHNGNKTYVDFDRISKVNGLVYHWAIFDYLEPGSGSYKKYHKVDCDILRRMELSRSAYKFPMAEGTADSTFTPDPKCQYAQPDSTFILVTRIILF